MYCCTARRNGRAPYCSSLPNRTSNSLRLVGQDQFKLFITKALYHFRDLNVNNSKQFVVAEAVENDDFVDAVQELGIEDFLDLVHDPGFHLAV